METKAHVDSGTNHDDLDQILEVYGTQLEAMHNLQFLMCHDLHKTTRMKEYLNLMEEVFDIGTAELRLQH